MKYAYLYETRIGRILIAEDGTGITSLSLYPDPEAESVCEDMEELPSEEYRMEETPLLRKAASQLKEYLEGLRKVFTLQLSMSGTPFQRKVWEALREIPYGETRSYKQIARAVGNEKACRAVGMANHNNPIMCIVPCHRVIGANGRLVGYAGGLSLKEELLNMEKERK